MVIKTPLATCWLCRRVCLLCPLRASSQVLITRSLWARHKSGDNPWAFQTLRWRVGPSQSRDPVSQEWSGWGQGSSGQGPSNHCAPPCRAKEIWTDVSSWASGVSVCYLWPLKWPGLMGRAGPEGSHTSTSSCPVNVPTGSWGGACPGACAHW